MADKLIKKTVVRPCPICSNGSGEVLHTQRFAIPEGHPLPGSYDVVCCAKCGFVYADTPAKQEDYDQYYENFSKYEDLKTASGSGLLPWDKERSENVALELVKALPDHNCSIIDIGCANGGILSALKSSGYNNLAGMDPSSACVRYIQKECGISRAFEGGVFCPMLTDDKSLCRSFDCVILSHVIEHIYDLKKAIENVSRLLKKDGIMYVEVPDASRYSDYYIVPYYYFDCEHINHFDERSLKNLLMLNGLEFISYSKNDRKVSGRNVYPVVSVIGKKPDNKVIDKEPAADFAVKESVLKYIDKSKNAEDSIRIKLEALVKSREPVVVWGAGSFTERLLEGSLLGKCNIIAFIDNDSKKWGNNIKGVTVSSPDRVKDFAGTLVVASALFSDEICEEVKSMGVGNKIVVLK